MQIHKWFCLITITALSLITQIQGQSFSASETHKIQSQQTSTLGAAETVEFKNVKPVYYIGEPARIPILINSSDGAPIEATADIGILTRDDTSEFPEIFTEINFSDGTAEFEIPIDQPALELRLAIRYSESIFYSQQFSFIQKTSFSLPTAEILYSPITDTIFVSEIQPAGNISFFLKEVDPYDGTIKRTKSLPGVIGTQMVLDNDPGKAWIGLRSVDNNSVNLLHFNLANYEIIKQYRVEVGDRNDVRGILPLEGASDKLIIYADQGGVENPGLFLFDLEAGVLDQIALNFPNDWNEIISKPGEDNFYLHNDTKLIKYSLDSNLAEFSEVERSNIDQIDPFPPIHSVFWYENSIIRRSGEIFDSSSLEKDSTFPVSPSQGVLLNRQAGVIFFMQKNGIVKIFDINDPLKNAEIPLPFSVRSFSNFRSWGVNGIAHFDPTRSDLTILRLPGILFGDTPDLKVTVDAPEEFSLSSGPQEQNEVEVTFTIQNINDFPISNLEFTSSIGPDTSIDIIPENGVKEIKHKVILDSLGKKYIDYRVYYYTPSERLLLNSGTFTILVNSRKNGISNEILIGAEELLATNDRENLIVSYSKRKGELSDGVRILEAETGRNLKDYPFPARPVKMRLSGDQSKLYVLLVNQSLYRIDLQSDLITREFDAGVLSMATIPSEDDSYVVAFQNRVEVYDSGTVRPNAYVEDADQRRYLDIVNGEVVMFERERMVRLAISSEGLELISNEGFFLYAPPGPYTFLESRIFLIEFYYDIEGRILRNVGLRYPFYFDHDPGYFYAAEGNRLQLIEQETFNVVEEIAALEVGDGSIGHIVRWGQRGLAFITDQNQLIITKSPLVKADNPDMKTDLKAFVEAEEFQRADRPVHFSTGILNLGEFVSGDSLLEITWDGLGNVTLVDSNNQIVSMSESTALIQLAGVDGETEIKVGFQGELLSPTASIQANLVTSSNDPDLQNNKDNFEIQAKDLNIGIVQEFESVPDDVYAEEPFTVEFSLQNIGADTMYDLKVNLLEASDPFPLEISEVVGGAVVDNSILVPLIEPGSTVAVQVTLLASEPGLFLIQPDLSASVPGVPIDKFLDKAFLPVRFLPGKDLITIHSPDGSVTHFDHQNSRLYIANSQIVAPLAYFDFNTMDWSLVASVKTKINEIRSTSDASFVWLQSGINRVFRVLLDSGEITDDYTFAQSGEEILDFQPINSHPKYLVLVIDREGVSEPRLNLFRNGEPDFSNRIGIDFDQKPLQLIQSQEDTWYVNAAGNLKEFTITPETIRKSRDLPSLAISQYYKRVNTNGKLLSFSGIYSDPENMTNKLLSTEKPIASFAGAREMLVLEQPTRLQGLEEIQAFDPETLLPTWEYDLEVSDTVTSPNGIYRINNNAILITGERMAYIPLNVDGTFDPKGPLGPDLKLSRVADNQIRFSFKGLDRVSYQLQSSLSLENADWVTLDTPMQVEGREHYFDWTITDAEELYFQVTAELVSEMQD